MKEFMGYVSFQVQLSAPKKRKLIDQGNVPLLGYVFLPLDSSECYLLSVTQELLLATFEACRSRRKVRIHQYRLIRFASVSTDVIVNGLLEVQAEGMQLVGEAVDDEAGVVDLRDIWTLREIQRLEAVDQVQGCSNSHNKSRLYSLQATVHAISPIITMDTSDPFCLLELYETASTCSCVAVIRKSALSCSMALQSGQCVALLEVKRQRWKIPQMLMEQKAFQLQDRVPEYVFVVDKAEQVQFDGGGHSDAMPTYTLTTVSGRVVSVHMLEMGSVQHIHYVELESAILYLTYFPMTTTLRLPIRPGAHIQVTNVHRFDSRTYGACLRSNLVVLQHSLESMKSIEFPKHDPCAFLRIRRTYLAFVLRKRVAAVLSELNIPPTVAVPEPDDIVEILLDYPSAFGPRNAYAEFFDHHGMDECPSSSASNVQGCHLTHYASAAVSVPMCVGLDHVHSVCLDLLKNFMSSIATTKALQVGWTSSTVHSTSEIFGATSGSGTNDETVWMLALATSSSMEERHQWLASSARTIVPVNCESAGEVAESNPQLVGFRLQSVILTCLCLGLSEVNPNSSRTADASVCLLPPCSDEFFQRPVGACVVVEQNGCPMIGSMQFVCTRIKSFGSSISQTIPSQLSPDRVPSSGTLQQCLDTSQTGNIASYVECLLCRKFFKLARVKNGVYTDFMVLLSHAGKDGALEHTVGTLQSADVKPSVHVSDSRRLELRRHVRNALPSPFTDDMISLACVWWKLASSPRTCALLGVSWDEVLPNASRRARTLGVRVRIPQSAVNVDRARGYVRLRCSVDDIRTSYVSFACRNEMAEKGATIDYLGGRRFYTGMLEGRMLRRTVSIDKSQEVTRGELVHQSREFGVPTTTLAALHWAVCADLGSGSRHNLAPSLVREIRRAYYLGVSYCRANAECTKCFYQLKEKSGRNGEPSTHVDDGVVTSVSMLHAPSFWGRPMNTGLNPDPTEAAMSVESCFRFDDRTRLRCPNNCSLAHAAIKWECSGTVDDGTGQAKLYAERDAALMLLGMSPEVVRDIELGAWLQSNGVIFTRGMMPKPHLRAAVLTARALALDMFGGRRRRLHANDVLKFLTPSARADYLMQTHCLESKEPTRPLTYFVRCKPLSDETIHLNQTEIDVVSPDHQGVCASRGVATYSLPPLKLNLVDACVPGKEF